MINKLLKNKRLVGVYILWVTLHFTFLLASWGRVGQHYGENHKHDFWPLTDQGLFNTYDLTEFIVYSIAPALIILAITLINTKQDED